MDLLPPRPYQLKRGWAARTRLNAALLLLVTAGLGALMAGYGGRGALAHLDERKVWETGEVAAWVEVGGKQTDHSLLGLVPFMHEYALELTFEDVQGTERAVKQEFETLFVAAPTDADPELHYDPANPARVALSWGQEAAPARWGWSLLMLALGLLMLGFGVQVARVAWRTVASARACAATGTELLVRVVSLAEVKGRYGKATGKFQLEYDLPTGLRRRGGKRKVTLDGPPLLVNGATQAVALVSPAMPDWPTFPLADLHPYAPTEAQRTALAGTPAGGAAA